MTLLSIDTCSSRCSVALSYLEGKSPVVLAKDQQDIGRGHAEMILPQIDRMVAAAGLTPSKISQIAVAIGPGSFAGTRVGISVARMLGSSLEVPVSAVGVLQALIYYARERLSVIGSARGNSILAVLDAKRGESYVSASNTNCADLLQPIVMSNEQLLEFVVTSTSDWVVLGSGRRLFKFLSEDKVRTIDIDYPDIDTISCIGHISTIEPIAIEPLYLRNADAKKQSGPPSLHFARRPL